MDRLRKIHPGEILQEEFLDPFDITAYRLAKEIKIPQTRISQILKGRRRITADTALRLQDDYDLAEERMRIGNELSGIQRMKVS
jgi:addiction module HigA family antidote